MKFLLLVLALFFASCGSSPTAPTNNQTPCAPTYHRQLVNGSPTFICAPN